MLVSERATTKKLQTCLPSCSTAFKLTCFCDFHKICPTPVGRIQSHGPIITRECEYEAYQIYQIHKCRYRILFIKGGWRGSSHFSIRKHIYKLEHNWCLLKPEESPESSNPPLKGPSWFLGSTILDHPKRFLTCTNFATFGKWRLQVIYRDLPLFSVNHPFKEMSLWTP